MNGFVRAASLAVLASGAAIALGCWAGQDVDRTGDHVAARRGSVVVEGCALDDAETTTLSQPSTKKVLSEVILLCAAIQPDGSLAPAAADDRTALGAQVQALHTLGYRVSLATTIGASWDVPSTSHDTTNLLEKVDRTKVASALQAIVQQSGFDGVELAFPPPEMDGNVRASLGSLVQAIGVALRPARTVGVFLPPNSQTPTDVPGGDAYDPGALRPYVDRFRLMTLDYSCCGAPLGPTIDPGWAVDVERFAAQQLPGATPLDVAYPLYGWDTTISGSFGADTQTSVTYAQAESLATTTHANVARGPTGAPYFDYVAADGTHHEVWFDDATSTLRALHGWDEATLPLGVGVVFYGLGAEDPRLWDAIAKEMP